MEKKTPPCSRRSLRPLVPFARRVQRREEDPVSDFIHFVPEWKCVDDQPDNNRRLHYSRFAISPLLVDQAMTIGVALRRALLTEVEGISIISANIEGAVHEYSTLDGVRESVDEILLNLKQIVLKGEFSDEYRASIFAQGPGVVTAEHIKFPSSILAVDPDQPIATLINETQLCIELFIKRGIAKQLNRNKKNYRDFFIDATFTPVQKANFSIHSVGDPEGLQQLLILEIWTNKTLTPAEALYQAHASLLNLFHKTAQTKKFTLPKDSVGASIRLKSYTDPNFLLDKQRNENLNNESLSIDELELLPRISNSLKRANIHTIADLLSYTQDDLLKIKNFGRKSVEQVSLVLRKRFNMELLPTK
uniref:DNA-directed RNA polymerase subunit alpha n=1 Tax=Euastrum ansatum TaxID=2722870 RepID=A0A8U0LUB0_9VIRI|nr:RNA polymerase alpha subunit [Euastrum ansatum]